MPAQHPIGVFDSGIGGLSVLQALRAELPHEQFIYVADSGHAPYGERDAAHVIARAQAITQHLLQAHGIQTMVVACNTATAAAVEQLRRQYPSLPIVGVEPALKPAAQTSRTHRVGVMATRGTLQSNKFKTLLDTLQGQADFTVQACDGLADAIERQDSARIEALCRQYTQAMGRFGSAPDEIDTLVLGCTHYPFAANTLRTLVGDQVQLLESGAPVARQTRRVLPVPSDVTTHQPMLRICTTGHPQLLQAALSNWLQINPEIETLRI